MDSLFWNMPLLLLKLGYFIQLSEEFYKYFLVVLVNNLNYGFMNNSGFRMPILVLTLVITTIFGFLAKASGLSPFTSSFHMIFTIISIALAASITAKERV